MSSEIEKVFYSNYVDAYDDGKKGKIIGFLEFFPKLDDEKDFEIKVQLDQTNYHLDQLIRHQIHKANDKLKNKTSVIVFEEHFHGSASFKSIFIPSYLIE